MEEADADSAVDVREVLVNDNSRSRTRSAGCMMVPDSTRRPTTRRVRRREEQSQITALEATEDLCLVHTFDVCMGSEPGPFHQQDSISCIQEEENRSKYRTFGHSVTLDVAPL